MSNSKNLLAALIDSLPDAVLVIDINKKIIIWNRAIEKLTGVPASEMIGKSRYEYSLPFYGIRRPILIDYVLNPNQDMLVEYSNIAQNNDAVVGETIVHFETDQEMYLWSMSAPIYNSHGQLLGAIQSIRDVTNQKKTAKAIEDNERRLRHITEHLLDIVVETDERGIIKYASPSHTPLFRYNPQEEIGKSIYDSLHPDDIMSLVSALSQALNKKKPKAIEVRKKDAGGQYHWVELIGNPVFNDKGNINGAIFVGRVINERKLAQETFKASEERYRELFENANDIVFIKELSGKYLDINNAAEHITGFQLEELLDMGIEELVDHPYVDLAKQMINQKIEHGGTTRYEIEIINKHKKKIPLEVSSRFIRYDDQNIAIQGTARVITKRRQAEKALIEEKERLAIILSSIDHGIITTDNNGLITFMNTNAELFFEWKNDDAHGKDLLEIVSLVEGYDFLNHDPFFDQEGQPQPVDIQVINNLGEIRLLSTTFTRIRRKNDINEGIIFVFRDVTELRKSESRIALSRKLESIGQLAAGIAHEINNPMQYIGDNLVFLNNAFATLHYLLDEIKTLVSQEDVHSFMVGLRDLIQRTENQLSFFQKEIPLAIHQSLEGVDGISHILTGLRDFAHPGSDEKKMININTAISGTISITKNEWKHVADLELKLGNDLPQITVAANQINQVLLNMIVNACHTIQDAISKGHYKKGLIQISSSKNGSYIEVIISDNGLGIPAGIIDRIFDPFFTTKMVGKGTGQGLAISHDIVVNKHNGSIDVTSEVSRGTTFYIRLPLGYG